MDTPAQTAAPQAPGVSPGSPPAPTETAPDTRSDLQRMTDRAVEIETRGKAPRAPEPAPEAPVVDENAEPEAPKEEPEVEVEPKSVPMKAFKERLAQSAKQTEKARAERDDFRLKHQQAAEGQRILNAEVERLTELLREGKAFDERDELLSESNMREEARRRSEELLAAHRAALEEQTRSFHEEQQVTDIRDRMSRDLDTAVEKYDHIPREFLIAEMRKENTKAKPRTFVQIAAEYDARITERVRQRMPAERPSAPSTTRSPSGGSPTQYTNDLAGMTAFAEALNIKRGA